MSFLEPGRLWLLLLVGGLLAAYVLAQGRRRRDVVRFTNVALLASVAPTRPGWRRHVPALLILLALAVLIVAFARPVREVRSARDQSVILLAIDVSLSMQATDAQPNRLVAAQEAASAFVEDVPPDLQVGLITFAESASLLVPPGEDRTPVLTAIDNLDLAPGTAIAEAIFVGLNAIEAIPTESGEPAPARIVLLSDGETTAGRPNEDAVAAAQDAGVPVSTIAFGEGDATIEINGETVPVSVDPAALQAIAEGTGGRFFRAASTDELRAVYEDIERAIGFTIEQDEVTAQWVGWALSLLLIAFALSLLWTPRLP